MAEENSTLPAYYATAYLSASGGVAGISETGGESGSVIGEMTAWRRKANKNRQAKT